MLEFFKKAASRVSGAITGLFTGFLAGFIPGKYYFFDHAYSPTTSEFESLFYLVSLPFFMAYQMYQGAVEGATKGLMASFYYPKTLNESFITERNNLGLLAALNSHLKKISNFSLHFLKDEEINEFISVCDSKYRKGKISKEQFEKFNEQLEEYDEFLNKIRCPISGKVLKEIKSPIFVEVDDKHYVCDDTFLKQKIESCLASNTPVALVDFPKPSEIMTAKSLAHQTIPKHIRDFIGNVRTVCASYHYIYQYFGLENRSSPDVLKMDEENDMANKSTAEVVLQNHSKVPEGEIENLVISRYNSTP